MKPREERRAAVRYDLFGEVRFLLRGDEEGTGNLLNMSECGLALTTEAVAHEGDKVIVYPQGLGRIPGRISRNFDGGFCVAFELSARESEIMKDRIAAAVEGMQFLRLGRARSRSSLRVEYNIKTMAQLENCAEPVECVIVDMSQSGARIKCGKTPEIGSRVAIGAMNGVVVRHYEGGFAVEFFRAATGPMKITNNADNIEDLERFSSNARKAAR